MKKQHSRLLIATLIGIAGASLLMVFNVGPEEIDQFFEISQKYIISPLGVLVALGLLFHRIFPTKKQCPTCGNKLTGLLSPRLITFYHEASESNDRKTLMKSMYICDNCRDAFSPSLKRTGNI